MKTNIYTLVMNCLSAQEKCPPIATGIWFAHQKVRYELFLGMVKCIFWKNIIKLISLCYALVFNTYKCNRKVSKHPGRALLAHISPFSTGQSFKLVNSLFWSITSLCSLRDVLCLQSFIYLVKLLGIIGSNEFAISLCLYEMHEQLSM